MHDAQHAPQVPNIISLDLREGDRRWDALMSKEPYAYTVRLRPTAFGAQGLHALCVCAVMRWKDACASAVAWLLTLRLSGGFYFNGAVCQAGSAILC